MKKKTTAAVDSYVAAMGEISALLGELKAAADNHLGVAPEAVNWGNVGTAQHLLALLNEAAAFAGTRSEN